MNLKEIRQMINLMNENDIMEIELEREGTKVKIKKAYGEVVPAPKITMSAGHREEKSQTTEMARDISPKSNSRRKEIKSPMVGTFYRASAPDVAPYVEVGQIIEAGQTLCIVEAMKLMNEIKSEMSGKIVEIAAENASPVEFGQVLFFVEPI